MAGLKALIVAAGAIGQLLGGRLLEAGHDVTLWTTPRHANAFAATQGKLHVTGASEGSWRPKAVTDEPSDAFDAVVLTAKAHQTASFAPACARRVRPDGFVLSLQNGFGNGAKLLRGLPSRQVAVGVTSHGVELVEPGALLHHGAGPTVVGPTGPAQDEAGARQARVLLEDAGWSPEYREDMRPVIWRKALVNHAVNPVAALHGVTNGALQAGPLQGLAEGLLAEGAVLARRARVGLEDGELRAVLRATLARTAGNRCSMLQDVAAHRPTEVEQITGRLVRLAERLLVSMPRSEAMYGRMKDLEASYLGEAATRMAWDELAHESDPF